jgi:hypothetical protein
MTRAISFTKAQVRRAVQAAEEAGMKVTRITVNPDGSITVGGENPQVPVDAKPKALAASWDDA